MKPRIRARARNYKAARPDRLVAFPLGPANPARVLARDLRGLVAHSRHVARNNDYARAFLSALARNVVGPKGLALRPMAMRRDGVTPDAPAREAIKAAWMAWSRAGRPTTCGRLSWVDLQRLAVVTCARDGAFIARHVTTGAGYRLQVLSFDHLDTRRQADRLAGGGYIRAGIEYDAGDRPVAYWLHAAPQDDGRDSARAVRTPARAVLYLSRVEEPGQPVGRPWWHTALRGLAMIDDFEGSAIAAAAWGAKKLAFIKTPEGDASAPESPDDAERRVEALEVDELPPGADLASFNPQYPDAAVGPFVAHMLHRAAAGMGLSYATLTGDLKGASFSSLRAGRVEEQSEWAALQEWFAAQFCDPIFERWLAAETLRGGVAGVDARDLARVSPRAWRPRTWPSITPREEAQTWAALYDLRAMPPSALAEKMGVALDDLLDAWRDDLAAFDAAGVPRPITPGDPADDESTAADAAD